MGALMQDLPIHRPEIFRPQILNMDQRPLSAAEAKVLEPGKLEILLFLIVHL